MFSLRILLLCCCLCFGFTATAGAAPAPDEESLDAILASSLSKVFGVSVDTSRISDLRENRNYGRGEIALAYSLADRSRKPVSEVFTLREKPLGWGKVAQALGLSVGDVRKKCDKVFKDGKMDKEKTDLEQLLEDEKHNPPVKGRNAPGADKHQVHLQQNDNDKDKNTGNGKGKN